MLSAWILPNYLGQSDLLPGWKLPGWTYWLCCADRTLITVSGRRHYLGVIHIQLSITTE